MDNQRLGLTAEIVAAYVANNSATPGELTDVIRSVYAALADLDQEPGDGGPADRLTLTKAQIRKSITPDVLISFEDGRPYKMLRRHLKTRGMTPMEYREKWGLPNDYPMTAPSYSASRSELAKSIGLGARGRNPKAKRAKRGRSASRRV